MHGFVKRFLIRKSFLSVLFAVLILVFMNSSAQAQNDGWKSSLIVPGSQTLVDATTDFPECLTVETYFKKDWYHCKDENHTSKMGWDTVWNKVHKNFDFTISEPGRMYIVFTSKVPKDVFYYGDPTVGLSYRGKEGKWQSAWLGGAVRSVAYHGGKIRDTSPYTGQSGPPPIRYKINADGTIKIDEGVAHLEPGHYRLTIVSATRFNNNTGERTYVPSEADAKVIFIPDSGNNTDINNNIGNKIHPTKDAYVYAYNYRNWNRSNRGKYDQLVVGWHPTGGESRAYIKFAVHGSRQIDKSHHQALSLPDCGRKRGGPGDIPCYRPLAGR